MIDRDGPEKVLDRIDKKAIAFQDAGKLDEAERLVYQLDVVLHDMFPLEYKKPEPLKSEIPEIPELLKPEPKPKPKPKPEPEPEPEPELEQKIIRIKKYTTFGTWFVQKFPRNSIEDIMERLDISFPTIYRWISTDIKIALLFKIITQVAVHLDKPALELTKELAPLFVGEKEYPYLVGLKKVRTIRDGMRKINNYTEFGRYLVNLFSHEENSTNKFIRDSLGIKETTFLKLTKTKILKKRAVLSILQKIAVYTKRDIEEIKKEARNIFKDNSLVYFALAPKSLESERTYKFKKWIEVRFSGYGVSQIAGSFDVNRKLIYEWKKKSDQEYTQTQFKKILRGVMRMRNSDKYLAQLLHVFDAAEIQEMIKEELNVNNTPKKASEIIKPTNSNDSRDKEEVIDTKTETEDNVKETSEQAPQKKDNEIEKTVESQKKLDIRVGKKILSYGEQSPVSPSGLISFIQYCIDTYGEENIDILL